jgi:hypothetical protein
MKEQLPKLKKILQLVALLSVFGVFSIAQAQIVVDLRVSGDEGRLKAMTHGTCAGPGNQRGCVAASGRVLINFVLTGKTNCSAGGKWILGDVVLRTEEDKDAGPGISEVAATDFDADEYSGVVKPNKAKESKHIQIRNHNTEEYDVWYTVSAHCAASNSTISMDPRIRNDGTGGGG